jgi:hypothetical protein
MNPPMTRDERPHDRPSKTQNLVNIIDHIIMQGKPNLSGHEHDEQNDRFRFFLILHMELSIQKSGLDTPFILYETLL